MVFGFSNLLPSMECSLVPLCGKVIFWCWEWHNSVSGFDACQFCSRKGPRMPPHGELFGPRFDIKVIGSVPIFVIFLFLMLILFLKKCNKVNSRSLTCRPLGFHPNWMMMLGSAFQLVCCFESAVLFYLFSMLPVFFYNFVSCFNVF